MTTELKTVVHLDGISKRFGSTVAIEHLDIRIGAGEFVTFLGPSGCGKSTTLRILGGFEKPDNGRVVLDGEDVTQLPPNKRNVNMVFQDYALFPHMTVQQNISFGLELTQANRAAINTRVGELTALLELENLEGRYPEQLSGGQRQRVALARALALHPSLLLLDEPLGALDAKLRAQVQGELKSIQRRTNTTFFFVTHDQDEALTMSDRIVVLNQGKVEQDGTPEDLYFRPTSRFVAMFIGETNLLSGQVVGIDNGDIVFDWSGVLVRGRSVHLKPAVGEQVTASLRFEMIRCYREKPAQVNTVKGRMVNKIFKGSRIIVEIAIDDVPGEMLCAYIDAGVADGLNAESVWLGWDSDGVALVGNNAT